MASPVPQREARGAITPVQVRLAASELAQLDAFIEHMRLTSHGLHVSRAQALRIAALEGLRSLMPEATPHGGKRNGRRP